MEYPSLLKRVQSALADQIIAFSLIGLLITVANVINEDSVALKVTGIILGVSYEPLMMFAYRTIGQMLTGIKVTFENEDIPKPLRLLTLYFRFILKIILGWISLLTVTSHRKRLAIHDLAAGTLVVFNKPREEVVEE